MFASRSERNRKALLLLSVAGNLGLLGYFKYVDFGLSQVGITPLGIILPIGISFYTFQSLSYTIDIYRGQLEPSKSLREFALFIAFFPQLVAGPILRASQFLPQLRRKISITSENVRFGTTLMMIGFLKKMLFADNIAPMVNEVFADPMGESSLVIIATTVAFGFQIYGDFSGYSDIAIGAATVLGFSIPANFNKPYLSRSPREFWSKWHISLSNWLRDYLYFPLGGNRKSKGRTWINIAVVMFLGGLWHGASWNFAIWGLLHGSYLIVHRAFRKVRIPALVSLLVTQYFIFLAWIPFRLKSVEHIIYSMQKYVIFDFQVLPFLEFVVTNRFPLFILGLFVLLHVYSYAVKDLPRKISNLSWPYRAFFIFISTFLILMLFDGNPEPFLYFQF